MQPNVLDVVFFCEGTYPYVSGGVSSWIHALVSGMPDLKFGLVFLAPNRDFRRKLKYQVPDCVKEMVEVYIYDVIPTKPTHHPNRIDPKAWAAATKFFNGLFEGEVPDFEEIFPYLTPQGQQPPQLGIYELAYSPQAWQILTEIYQKHSPNFPFTDFFWNWRFISFPILQLLNAPIPQAKVYHTVTTGWSGLLAVLAKMRTGRPLILTEHGIYTNERRIEIVKADWLFVERNTDRNRTDFGVLKTLWINLFNALGRLCYRWSDQIYTLFEGNRRLQLEAGAPARKIEILPNGVDVAKLSAVSQAAPPKQADAPFRVGFVGRVVPIKDVKTFIQACRVLQASVNHFEALIIGPTEEDTEYFEECKNLCQLLQVESVVQFLGPQDLRQWYPKLDALVLTSVSEGQPLVILEGYAYGIPCVASDVGACSELIYGRPGSDQDLGPSGFVTRVGAPNETAKALQTLAADPALRARMGKSGFERVRRFYDLKDLLARYHGIYSQGMLAPEVRS